MKKTIIAALLLLSINAFSQKEQVKDSTVKITMTLQEYRQVLNVIDNNIDSKALTKQLLDFFQKRTELVADKPKSPIK